MHIQEIYEFLNIQYIIIFVEYYLPNWNLKKKNIEKWGIQTVDFNNIQGYCIYKPIKDDHYKCKYYLKCRYFHTGYILRTQASNSFLL